MLSPKTLNKIGLIACIFIIAACFMPWITFTQRQETFSGFYTKTFPNGTSYGRPGKLITIFAIIILVFMYLPKVWAKRTNLFLSGFLMAYVVAVYIRFTNSLFDNEIERRYGLFILIICAVLILLACIFPDMRIKPKKPSGATS